MSVQNNGPVSVGDVQLPYVHPTNAKHEEISKLFDVPIQEVSGIPDKDLEKYCMEKTGQLLESGTLRAEKITSVANLFLRTLWPSTEVYEDLKKSVDLFNPNSAFVIVSLSKCIERIARFSSFSEAKTGRENYIRDHKEVKDTIEDVSLSIRELITHCEVSKRGFEIIGKPELLDKACLQTLSLMNGCPLYTAKDWFGGQNTHEAYVLREENASEGRWIFKPTVSSVLEGSQIYYDEFPSESIANTHSECAAYELNHHKKFPIPATYYVDIMGYTGSVQLVVNNTIDLEVDKKDQIAIIDLQKIAIFDLIFSNSDRNSANLLYVMIDEIIHVIGIDHDSCMCLDGRPLKFEWLEFFHAFNQPFLVELRELVSSENVQKYEEVMRNRDIDEKAIKWMRTSANKLQSEIGNNEKNASEVIKELIKRFEELN